MFNVMNARRKSMKKPVIAIGIAAKKPLAPNDDESLEDPTEEAGETPAEESAEDDAEAPQTPRQKKACELAYYHQELADKHAALADAEESPAEEAAESPEGEAAEDELGGDSDY